jgi:hypothetical protein
MAVAATLAVLAGSLVLGLLYVSSLARGELAHVGEFQVYDWDPSNAFKSNITNSEGIYHYQLPIGVFYALPVAHPTFVFPLLTPFLLLGLWSLGHSLRPHAALLLGWPLMVYIFLIGIAWENPRFSLALFPPLAALVGLGFQLAWDWSRVLVSGNQRPQSKATAPEMPTLGNTKRNLLGTDRDINKLSSLLQYWRPFLVGWCALALAGSLAWSTRDLRNFTSINQVNIAAAQWVAEQVPAGATVITFGVTQTMEHRTELDVEEIYLLDETTLSKLLSTQLPTYLYLDLFNIESQWLGKSPHLNYQWLRENTAMREIGRYPPYTLFYIEA